MHLPRTALGAACMGLSALLLASSPRAEPAETSADAGAIAPAATAETTQSPDEQHAGPATSGAAPAVGVAPEPASVSESGPDAPPPTPPTPESRGRAATMDQVAESSEQELHFGHTKARYSLNFFGDFSFGLYSPRDGDHQPSFLLGDQDFLIRGQLGNHLVATTEFGIGFGGTSEASVDLERLGVRWQDTHFFVDAGRTHTDIGYWNDAYHHGHWLQPTIDRPRWVRFEDEGGLLPVHWVGVSAGASMNVGAGTLRAAVSVGNGRGKVVDDIRNGTDYSPDKAVHGLIEYLGLGVPDLRVGISGIYDRIAPQSAQDRPALPDQAIQEFILGAHAAYSGYPLLVICEGYLITHSAADRVFRTYGGFGLAGYAIGAFMPYVELSKIAGSGGSDPFFMPDPALATGTFDILDAIAGFRIDLSGWSALKFEYQFTHAPHQHELPSHAGVANLSWGF
jgi:hypothetical protein